MLKGLFVLETFSDFLVMQKKDLLRELWLVSKFMTLHTGQQIITKNILPNISYSKISQGTKFDLLIK